jgi:hypothetical protein
LMRIMLDRFDLIPFGTSSIMFKLTLFGSDSI